MEKPERERGYYIHPELYGAPEEKSIAWARHPDLMKRMKERQAPSHPAIRPVAQAQAALAGSRGRTNPDTAPQQTAPGPPH